MLADVSEHFKIKCIEIYELDPAYFLSAPGLAWQASLKKTEVEIELLTNIDMLLMVEKSIQGGICHAIHRHAKANDKYTKNYDKNFKSSYLIYLDADNLYGWAMPQKLSVNDFEGEENIHKFNEDFIKNYDDNINEEYILEVDVECLKKVFNLHSDLPFLPERKKIEKCNELVCTIQDKKSMLFT